ncbi:MAG: beta-N-acetylglucosaminidase domain-containing protein [Gemmatimonadota bacterium]|nr:MAG: beta-N-acetylglucosaminidase domain-containing protein [Gemmatimonadota bacterium]
MKTCAQCFFAGLVMVGLLVTLNPHQASCQVGVRQGSETHFRCPTDLPEIFPTPVEVEYLDRFHPLRTESGADHLVLVADGEEEVRAARIFNHQLDLMGLQSVPVVEDMSRRPPSSSVAIRLRSGESSLMDHGKQAYSLRPMNKGGMRIIEASGAAQRGLIYAATALSQLVFHRNGVPHIREAVVNDWPAYGLRIVKIDPAPESVGLLFDWMARYRMSCLSILGRKYAWWTVEEEYAELLDACERWEKEYGGVDLMLMYNIYEKKHIVISDQAHVDGLKEVIAYGLDRGADKIMILADDTPPFQYGEGYILTDDRDKEKFSTMAEAHCFLMRDLENWIQSRSGECELYYAPAHYTYEEMHYGDMSLYVGTPWEEDVFGPFRRDHEIIGRELPESVFIIWCGPVVRSRRITVEDFEDWSVNFGGRAPFLWDNTIYSHHPFTTTTLFTAYDNDLPEDFHLMTAGNGMFVNGDAASEIGRVPSMTVNDYLWNPESYDSQRSLRQAIAHLYGREAIEPALDFKDAELAIRRMIGERLLWEEADSLWKVIRRARFITEKNPFYYHQNYGRLKALRLQLKYSVPEPDSLHQFKLKIAILMRAREVALEKLHNLGVTRLVDALRADMTKEDDESLKKVIGE